MRLRSITRAWIMAVLCTAALHAQPKMHFETIPAPQAAGETTGPSLALSPEGVAWLTWLEKQGAITALRAATFNATAKKWNPPRTIASGTNWFVNAADLPTLTLGSNGQATAVWFVNNASSAAPAADHDHGAGYHALISRTRDGGQSWSAPAPLTRESSAVEFAALATLADGRVLATWLDGRGNSDVRGTQRLYSRILGNEGPDTLVDGSVCDCCPLALTAFPDGSALLAYRGRSAEEVRDIRIARFRRGAWEESRALNNDDWRINGCPVNGPRLVSDGGRVAAAWFTAADNDPRVLASFSPDAGARFLMPLRINHTKPAGRVGTQLLHDGAILVSWVDVAGALWLHRISPDFALADRLQLAAAGSTGKSFPRTVLLHDYDGGKVDAQLLVAYVRDTPPALTTLLVEVPEGELLEAEKSCDCSPTPEQLRGFPVRGTVLESTQPAADVVRISLVEVPGIFEAGARDFKLPSGESRPPVGRQFLGRIEHRDGEWWLFDVRLIASPPKP